ncbi:5495_t:CDS:2, partial [Dentiscutata erythropus]
FTYLILQALIRRTKQSSLWCQFETQEGLSIQGKDLESFRIIQ